jgi:hypothetical protein
VKATVADAMKVVRVQGDHERHLSAPVWVDCAAANAIYADGNQVVVEQGPTRWYFVTASVENAKKQADELAVIGNRSGGNK